MLLEAIWLDRDSFYFVDVALRVRLGVAISGVVGLSFLNGLLE